MQQGKPIDLTQGYIAYLDPEDHERASLLLWCAAVRVGSNKVYAVRSVNGRHQRLGQFVLDTTETVRYIDGNPLNCCKSNLEIVSRAELSQKPRAIQKGKMSKHKGVSPKRSKWVSRINEAGKTRHLGTYKTEVEAMRAYEKASIGR